MHQCSKYMCVCVCGNQVQVNSSYVYTNEDKLSYTHSGVFSLSHNSGTEYSYTIVNPCHFFSYDLFLLCVWKSNKKNSFRGTNLFFFHTEKKIVNINILTNNFVYHLFQSLLNCHLEFFFCFVSFRLFAFICRLNILMMMLQKKNDDENESKIKQKTKLKNRTGRIGCCRYEWIWRTFT